jgi:NTP pyrophosphatase (non-canonical NTP hydrolase)
VIDPEDVVALGSRAGDDHRCRNRPALQETPRTLATVEISELQEILRTTYSERDAERGRDATFRWMTEEVGELAKAFRSMDPTNLEHEFGDVLAWLASLANLTGVDLERAATRYANGCPRCGASPCACAFDR